MTYEWEDLADSELRVKLEQRGWSAEFAKIVVQHREDDPETLDRALHKQGWRHH